MKIIKKITSVVLLMAFLLQVVGKMVIYVNYQINKKNITKTYCINKSKPQLHCDGKCHLKKQLKEQEKKENAPSNDVKEKYETQLFSENQSSFIFANHFIRIEYNCFYQIRISTPYLLAVFQPPTC